MKTTNLIVLILLLAGGSLFAQGQKKDKVKALKAAFITTELSLSSDEAQKFWPVYNAFEEKQYEIRSKKMRTLKRQLDAVDQLSEKDASALLDQLDDAEEDLHQNRKKLMKELRPVISASKILKLRKAEDDFNRRLLKQYRGKSLQRG